MKKVFLFLIILAFISCEKDPKTKENSEIEEESKTVEFRVKQGQGSAELENFASTVDPWYNFHSIFRIADGYRLTLTELDAISKGIYKNLYDLRRDLPSNGTGNQLIIPFTLIIE